MILMIFQQFCLHSSNSFTWQIAQFDQALGCNAFHCFPVWRLELEAYARYSSYKDALRMKRSQPCKRFTVRTSGKINLLDESVNEVARKGGKCGGSWGFSSLKALFSFSFLFRFLASCPLVVSIGELAVTSYILLQESE